jgi:peptidoglycan hydrolase-like protein with peptidoglycan-binding domain
MESLAYLELALASETDLGSSPKLDWQKLSSYVYLSLVSVLAIFTIFALPNPVEAKPYQTANRANYKVGYRRYVRSSGCQTYSNNTRLIQQKLKQLGYFNANITGCLGPITQAALRQFQRDNGLAVTGSANNPTLIALGIRKVGGVSTTGNDSLPSWAEIILNRLPKELEIGDQNAFVKLVQIGLNFLGKNVPVTGIYDQNTSRQVGSFQAANYIEPTGRVGKTTLRKLLGSVFNSNTNLPMNEILTVGSTNNPLVMLVQSQLQSLGLYYGSINGYFGTDTQDAVLRFQQSRGITPTGQVGATTLAALYSMTPGNNYNVGGYNNPNYDDPFPVELTAPPLRVLPPNNAMPLSGYPGQIVSRNTVTSSSPYYRVGNPRRWVGASNIAPQINYGSDIKEAQTILTALGYYKEGIDGVLGLETIFAINQFQDAQNLPVTGELNPATLARLRNSSQANRSSDYINPPNTNPGNMVEPPVDILDLQRRLSAQGFYNGPLNGIYDGATQAAINRAQRAYNISINDVLSGRF